MSDPARRSPGNASAPLPGSRIAWPLRTWLVVELFFAVSASISVGLRPADTANNFAWTIRPEVMASAIGAFYLALAPVVVLVLLARRWEMVRVFVIPGAVFTFAQLVVTLLHWDRFAVGTAPFDIWFASYLLPPPVFLGCYLWQQRRAVATGPAQPLGAPLRYTLLTIGLLYTCEGTLALIWPGWIAGWAPWRITPLNARALGGFFVLPGLLLLSIAREDDRDRVRLVSPFLVLALPLFVWQLQRFAAQVDWTHLRLAAWLALLAVSCLLGLLLARGDWRRALR